MQRVQETTGAMYVQMLREAEAKAQKAVAAARERKAERLKQAIVEAQIELDQLRKVKESAFLAKCAAHVAEDSEKKRITDEMANNQLAVMNERVHICAPMVVNLLESLVIKIDPAMHHNIVLRRLLEGANRKTHVPDDPHLCDEATFHLLEDCANRCEHVMRKLAFIGDSDMNNNYETSNA